MGFFRRRAGLVGVFAALLLVVVALGIIVALSARDEVPAQAAVAADLAPETPRLGLPRVVDGVARDSARVGDFVVVGGEFTQIELSNGSTRSVNGAYAFHINTGEFVEAFTPDFTRNGGDPIVLAVAPAGPDSVLLGGKFATVNGAAHKGIVKVTLSTGAVDASFNTQVDGSIRDIVLRNHRLFVGGEFEAINGVQRLRLAELNRFDGSVVTTFRADITGSTRSAPSDPFGPKYLAITRTNVLVVVHRGTTVAGQDRPGVALISLATGSVLPWRTDFYEGIENHTVDAEISPDGTYLVIGGDGGDYPFMGRDSAIRFDIDDPNATNVQPRWIARNFDSTYAVGISEDAVYLGGHFCWVEGPGSVEPWPGDGEFTNNNSCFGTAPASRFEGTVNRDQIAAFDPLTGKALDWDPGSDGLEGIHSIEVIDRGLLVGHDGTMMGRDGEQRRSWNVGRFGFFDTTMESGRDVTLGVTQAVEETCMGLTPTMTGTSGNDVLIGTDGDDVIVGGPGVDRIEGLGGNDVICGGLQIDRLQGGPGNDILLGGGGADALIGGWGNDELWGGLWKDILRGGQGDDLLRGGDGPDTLYGGIGNDELYGSDGTDVVRGGPGNDAVNGQIGDDTVIGGPGTDAVVGGFGIDTCAGLYLGQPNNVGDTVDTCER